MSAMHTGFSAGVIRSVRHGGILEDSTETNEGYRGMKKTRSLHEEHWRKYDKLAYTRNSRSVHVFVMPLC